MNTNGMEIMCYCSVKVHNFENEALDGQICHHEI